LRVKMHKFTINDQNKKGGQLREWQLSLAGMKLQEIKSLEAIVFVPQLEEQELNWNLLNPKLKTLIPLRRRVVQYLKKRIWMTCRSVDLASVFGSFGWLRWQLQTNECEATDLQIEQGWIQMKDMHPLYQLQVVSGDVDVRITLTRSQN
jgi:hypothetical protein